MDVALLLAEPEPEIRGYLERQLASDGFHVLNACFNGEALDLAERSSCLLYTSPSPRDRRA